MLGGGSCKDYDDVIDAKCEFTPFSECKATSGSCKDPKCKQTRTMKQVGPGRPSMQTLL